MKVYLNTVYQFYRNPGIFCNNRIELQIIALSFLIDSAEPIVYSVVNSDIKPSLIQDDSVVNLIDSVNRFRLVVIADAIFGIFNELPDENIEIVCNNIEWDSFILEYLMTFRKDISILKKIQFSDLYGRLEELADIIPDVVFNDISSPFDLMLLSEGKFTIDQKIKMLYSHFDFPEKPSSLQLIPDYLKQFELFISKNISNYGTTSTNAEPVIAGTETREGT